MTREEILARARERRAAIADMYYSGDWTPRQVRELNGGISRERLSKIIKAARRDAQRERCARGEHGPRIESEYLMWQDGVALRTPYVKCEDCGARIEP